MDTNLVVIIIGKIHPFLTKHPAAHIWIAFGTGKKVAYVHINATCNALGKCKSMSLSTFDCFDTTSAFWEKEVSKVGLEFISRSGLSHCLHVNTSSQFINCGIPNLLISLIAEFPTLQFLEHYTVVFYDN